MSADNGVYVLVTRGPDGEREYRVAYASAIRNITSSPDFPVGNGVLNRKAVLERFGDARLLKVREFVHGYALALCDQHSKRGVVEYGIQVLDFSTIPFPEDDRRQDQEVVPAG